MRSLNQLASQLTLPSLGSSDPVEPAPTAPEIAQLARQLPSTIHLGTSSWSFPGWVNHVYRRTYRPQALAHHGLKAYAQHPLLRGVGVDRAHYAPVPVAEMRDWTTQVPEDFRFLVKAHEACTLQVYPTHARYGRHAGSVNPLFLDPGYARDAVVQPYCEGLGAHGGVLLMQFAAQSVPHLGGPEKFAERLHRFLDALPRGPRLAVEVRNPELICRAYGDALAAVGAVHCFNALGTMPDIRTQARALRHVRFSALVLRWMRHAAYGYAEAVARYRPFSHLMDPDVTTRHDVAWLCQRALAADKPVFVVVNNKAEGCAPQSIVELATELVSKQDKDRAAPWDTTLPCR